MIENLNSLLLETNAAISTILMLVSLILFLIVFIIGLIYNRYKLLRKIELINKKYLESKDEDNEMIKEIINIYSDGNSNLINSLDEIRTVLVSIQNNRR
jgi:hypothetical protein